MEKVQLTNVEFSVTGVVTHYFENVWVRSNRCIEGGYFRKTRGKYVQPLCSIAFLATVDIKLVHGGIYTDGTTTFIAVDHHRIANVESEVLEFEAPKQLMLVASAFIEPKHRLI